MNKCKICGNDTRTITGYEIKAAKLCERCALKKVSYNHNLFKRGKTFEGTYGERIKLLFGHYETDMTGVPIKRVSEIVGIDSKSASNLMNALKRKGLVDYEYQGRGLLYHYTPTHEGFAMYRNIINKPGVQA